MAIGAIVGPDYEMYKQPINQTMGVNPFAAGAAQTSGGSGGTQFIGKEEGGLDQGMLAAKAQGFQNGLGGTNNPDNHKIFYAA